MGTPCLTRVYEDDVPLIAMLRQSDGYVSAHGHELARLLAGTTLVNGLSFDQDKVANGMGCLAATVIAHFKSGPGGFYLQPVTHFRVFPYVYDVRGAVGKPLQITVSCNEYDKIFEGTPEELLAFSEADE